jgi:ribosomal protein L17
MDENERKEHESKHLQSLWSKTLEAIVDHNKVQTTRQQEKEK